MGFATALSGLTAAATDLQVTGNNIANANTVGFKESRAEFADVYASSIGGVSSTLPGSGVRVTEVAQQFNQGNIEFTENSLDLAVNGNGFFSLSEAGADPTKLDVPGVFSRNGAFQLDKNGYVVTDQGNFLMGYRPNGTTLAEGFSQGVFTALQIDTAQGLPSATTTVDLKVNLDSRDTVPAVTPFDPTDSGSYNSTTSVTVFDSQGNSHIASTYFVKTAANQWDTYLYLDNRGITPGTPAATVTAVGVAPTATPIEFTSAGLLDFFDVAGQTSKAMGTIDLSLIDPNISVSPLSFTANYLGSTQFSSSFSVNDLQQNGSAAGNITGIDVDDTGAVLARFSNGSATPIGQVALARFASNQMLAKSGDTNWQESATSGPPIYGSGGANNFGSIKSAALEGSNVDLSQQLVHLIVAQQAYQANAQTITTEKTIIQTILNA